MMNFRVLNDLLEEGEKFHTAEEARRAERKLRRLEEAPALKPMPKSAYQHRKKAKLRYREPW